jgi:precorrin-2/cobalt-factor-2 C20-methyltransferase
MLDGVFYGVGVGPGDSKLLTLQAVDILSKADVIAVPTGGERQTALGAAASYIEGKPLLDCVIPMTKDKSLLEAAYKTNAENIGALLSEGKSVAYITIGDPSLYSTYSPVRQHISAKGYRSITAPGITSFCAAAALMNTPLCKGRQRLLIVPMSDEALDDCIEFKAEKVFMRPSESITDLKNRLYNKGYAGRCTAVTDCGLPGERIYESLDELEETGYFTLIFVKE